MTPRPRIAVTMGDPAGISTEICLHLLNQPDIAALRPIVFGDAGVLRRVAHAAGIPFNTPVIREWDDVVDGARVLDLRAVDADAVKPGLVDARSGEAAYRYVVAAIDAGFAAGWRPCRRRR